MHSAPLIASVLAGILGVSIGALQAGDTGGTRLTNEYDTSRTVVLTGRITGLDSLGTEGSLLLLNGKDRSDSWAIEGDPHAALVDAGWFDESDTRTVRTSTDATVTVWLPRKPSPAQSRLLALIDAQLVDKIPRTVFGNFVRAGQFAFGLDVTLADGRKLAFGTRRADERRK